MSSKFRSFLELCAWVGFAFVLSQTIMGLVSIPSRLDAARPKPRDRLVVNRVAYGIHVPFTPDKELARYALPMRGDVIIFNSPEQAGAEEALFIKRVIALPGDTIAVVNDQVVLNGKPLAYTRDERGNEVEQLGLRHYPIQRGPHARATVAPYTVPEGYVFVLGDNRSNSKDSRAWGPVALERIRGEAVLRAFSGNPMFGGVQ